MREFEVADNRSLVAKIAEKKNSVCDYMPPKTLGRPKGKLAMDACIKNVLSGFTKDIAGSGVPQFIGYSLLSTISQEALIRAGVETIADDATRKFVEFDFDDETGETHESGINEIEKEFEKYKVREIFNDAFQKDGYFGGCLIYIDVGELSDEEKAEPLIFDKKTFSKGMLKGLKVIEPVNIYPAEYNTSDPTDEHYFNPEAWYILGKKYHASRFLYICSNPTALLLKPAYNFFGVPRAQMALDYVAHFVENRESAQELLNKFSLTCWQTDLSQMLQGGECNDLIKRVRMFNRLKDNQRTLVFDKEMEDVKQINTPLGGVTEIVKMSLNLLTAVWRIPKIKYIGEGEGGLNASSREQMRSYYDFILGYKEKTAKQPLNTLLKIIQLNMGKEPNDAIKIKFPVLWELDDVEKAQMNKTQADRDALYIANGVLSQEEVRKRLSMDKNSEYNMIDVDDLPETTEEPLKDLKEDMTDEEERIASDMALDGRWITIGARKKGENGEDDEGRKGRHLYLDDGETPEEAIEELKDKDKKTEKSDKEDKSEKSDKQETKQPDEKSEEKDSVRSSFGYKNINKNIEKFAEKKKERERARKFVVDHQDE